MLGNYLALCQIPQKIVTTYGENGFALGSSSDELTTGLKLRDYARAGLIDTFFQAGEWHYRVFVPVKAVWINLPNHFDSAVLDLPDNIAKKDLILYEINPDGSFKEAIIPDSLWVEEWEFSKKKVRKLDPFIKRDNNDFIYYNLSPGFYPAKHKKDLDKKAKKEKEKKDKNKK